MFPDRRASPREPLALPISLTGDGIAITRDISEGGLYLLLPPGGAVDDWLAFEFALPEAGLKFSAVGEVVRIERGITRTGVAIRLHRRNLVPLN